MFVQKGQAMQHQMLVPNFEARLAFTRGGNRFLDGIDPRKTCHVVVDMQNGFMRPGALLEVPDARKVVPAINGISAALRAAGGMVAYTRFAYVQDETNVWAAFYSRFLDRGRAEAQMRAFAPSSSDLELWAGLDVAASDLVVDKTRFSAFSPDACGLDAILRARGIQTLIVSGTMTNCCCESTARDAMQMNYDVVFASDATAALTELEQSATLLNMALLFAEVASSEDIASSLKRGDLGAS